MPSMAFFNDEVKKWQRKVVWKNWIVMFRTKNSDSLLHHIHSSVYQTATLVSVETGQSDESASTMWKLVENYHACYFSW